MKSATRRLVLVGFTCSLVALAACGGPRVPTKAEWMQRYKEVTAGQVRIPKRAFVAALGEPTQAQALGSYYIWIYKCSDGQIQLKLLKTPMRQKDEVFVDLVTEF